jgi:hypothetical protein
MLVERLDTSFHSIDDLRAVVNIPTVFSIPMISSAAARRRRLRRLALTAVSVVVGFGLIVAGSRYLATGNEQIVRMTSRGQG